MISVEIKNFQAIAQLSLQIEGFTALVGRTNIGKSSIVRAINCALSGGSGSDFVRHDARSCARILKKTKTCDCFSSVKLTFAEGQSLLWEKGGKVNRYTVCRDGVTQTYDRVGPSVEVSDFLAAQHAPIKFGPSQSLLQVSSQFEVPFLLDLSGTTVADILSEVGQLDAINQAMALAAKDRRSAAATRKVRETDVQNLEMQLLRFNRLDEHLGSVRDLQAKGSRIQEAHARTVLVSRLYTGVVETIKTVRRLEKALEPTIPSPETLGSLARDVRRVELYMSGLETRRVALRGLERALTPPLPNRETLASTARRWSSSLRYEKAWQERQRLVERLQPLEAVTMPSITRVRDCSVQLGKVSRLLEQVSATKTVFVKAERLSKLALPNLSPVNEMSKRLGKMDRLALQQMRLEVEITRLEGQAAASETEVSSVLAEFDALGLCPTCHQGITPEHVVHD